MNKAKYDIQRIVIDSETLKELESMESKRRIVNTHVKRLKKVIEEGNHFDSPFVVNKKNGGYILLDGNHRYDAIKQWIADDADNKIEVDFVIYKNLDKQGERDIFSRWNSGRKQSSNDFVQIYSKEIGILQDMLSKFPIPVKIYPLKEGQRGVHFSSLMKAYFMTKEPFPVFKPYMGSAQNFVNDCVELDRESYENLKEFVDFFESVFGKMGKDNSYQTTTMLNCIMTIYFDNLEDRGHDDLVRLFKRHILGVPDVLILGRSGGRAATNALYVAMRSEFAKGRSREILRFRDTATQSFTEPSDSDYQESD